MATVRRISINGGNGVRGSEKEFLNIGQPSESATNKHNVLSQQQLRLTLSMPFDIVQR